MSTDKYSKKAGGHIGRNVVEITIKKIVRIVLNKNIKKYQDNILDILRILKTSIVNIL